MEAERSSKDHVERSARDRPMVSLLVAMRNEERHIGKTLASIFAQDYPADRLEVRIYDGGSMDRSWAIAEEMCAGRPLASVSRNPRIIQAAAWNLGIDEARGDILSIVSAHSELAPDYVSAAVETLERTGADMVGGPVEAIGEGKVGDAVAIATSTPFGVGNARFHFTKVEEEVDTVFMGFCRRETYQRLRFDEEMVRDQDDEFSYRLLDEGGRIICNPAIRSSYSNRGTFQSLWTQYYQYGFWKVRVTQKHPRQLRPRQLVPPVFVASIVASAGLAVFSGLGRIALVSGVGAYAAANIGASILAARSDLKALPYLPPTFAILHLAYGSGYLAGLVRFRNEWRSQPVDVNDGPGDDPTDPDV
jgi:glycosyltransferase involved in cell wall biosynthesis